MKLEEVIKGGVDIVPENEEQFNAVISILENRNILCHTKGDGWVISMCDDGTYFTGSVYFPARKLEASEFISSNQ